MNSREKGFLLLTGKLGNPERRVLTAAQLRTLAQRVRAMAAPVEDRELEIRDLIMLGYGEDMAWRILELLKEEELLEHYLRRGERQGCVPLTRVSRGYPAALRKRLGLDSPGCIWAKGDLRLLNTPMVALVGSRDLNEINGKFAAEAGRQAALQGYTLVSGNARGADRTAQNACLSAGGGVICVVADEAAKQPMRERVLYLSEDGFDEAFSSQRALSRNRCVHALGQVAFVAQCGYKTGGTWDGTVKNLRFGWSGVKCFDDGSEAMTALRQMGADLISREQLGDIGGLISSDFSLFDM